MDQIQFQLWHELKRLEKELTQLQLEETRLRQKIAKIKVKSQIRIKEMRR